jgi:hypothetical protein
MLDEDRFVDSRRFLAEYKVRIISIRDVGVGMSRLGGEEPKRFTAVGVEESLDGIVMTDIQEMPVIETGTFEFPIAYGESEWMYQMKRSSQGSARPGDIAGVLWYLGFEKHDMQPHGDRSSHLGFLATVPPLEHPCKGRVNPPSVA